ncbi:MAG: SDR family NAD(P)-dependent oxidoreductase [Oligoflexus sp.]|jgi:NAD(P)-dependent dehydrogenase (short-subunit alcohol dehydrogenase family)
MKIALVTGGSRGLGQSMALHLAKSGFDVIITYRERASDAERTIQSIRDIGQQAFALQLDVGQPDSIAPFAKAFRETLHGKLQAQSFDVLIHNAGQGVHAMLTQTTEQQLDFLYHVHFRSVYLLSQALLPTLRDGGRILNVSTGLTRFCIPGYSAYAAMKGAVEVLTRYMAKELGPRHITVNTLAPGAIETDFGGGAVRDNKDLNAYIASQTALGRAGKADDIGRLVARLVSEDAGWINAERIEASGGMFV